MGEVPGNRVVWGWLNEGGGDWLGLTGFVSLHWGSLLAQAAAGDYGSWFEQDCKLWVFGIPESDKAFSPLDVPLQSPRCRPAQ